MIDFFIIALLLIIAGVLLYPMLDRLYNTKSQTKDRIIDSGSSINNIEKPNRVIDLRGINEDVYILGNKSNIHFIQEVSED